MILTNEEVSIYKAAHIESEHGGIYVFGKEGSLFVDITIDMFDADDNYVGTIESIQSVEVPTDNFLWVHRELPHEKEKL